MIDTITINNEELASSLIALAILCMENGTDNCDLTLTTSNGKIKCEITFKAIKEDEEEEQRNGENS